MRLLCTCVLMATFVCPPLVAAPVDVIFDTDMGNDVDDALALGLLAAWAIARGWFALGVVAITAGALSKYVPVLLLPPVLLACHIDSWWNAPGAIDDGAGCAIIAAAALNVARAGQPLRTIRVLMAGAEEVGLFG